MSTVWNLDWNDLVSCSFCNVSISVRILSPGDDGTRTQTNAVTSTSVGNLIDALQQMLSQQAVLSPPVAPLPPPAAPFPTVFQPFAGPTIPPAQSEALSQPQVAAQDAAVPENVGAGAEVTPAVAVAPAPVKPSFATDTTVVPVTPAPSLMREPHRVAVLSAEQERTPMTTPPAVAPPPAIAPADGGPQAAHAEVVAVAAPADGGSRIPRRAPPPKPVPPADGPGLAAAAASPGSGPPPASTGSLLALLVFLVPGFAQWLWARAELRPRALRPGRPERPG